MTQWLRRKLRAWLGIADPSEPEAPVSSNIRIEATLLAKTRNRREPSAVLQMLASTGERNLVYRKIAPPVLPDVVCGGFAYDAKDDPGMLGEPTLAYDDAQNAPSWAYLNQANCGIGFPGYGYLAELSQRSEYRSPVETIASELTREWIDVTVRGKASAKKRKQRGEDAEATGDDNAQDGGLEDKIQQIEDALEEFHVRDHFRRIAEIDGFFGRAQLFIDIDPEGADPDDVRQLPLLVDSATIKKGSLRGFKVIEPIWTSPYSYNSTDPTKQDFYKPRAWFVIGKRTHASRLLTFISREVPDILKAAYNFGGISLTQLMEPYVFQWLRTRNDVSNLVHNFSVMCLKTDMSAVLQGDPDAGEGLIARATLFTQNRDNQNLMLLDKNREEMQEIHASLASLPELQAQAQEHQAAPSHLPLVKLLGVTPGGLNASSEGEIQVWYDHARSIQIFFFGKHLPHILDIIQLHLFGSIDPAIGHQFVPLSSPTVKELAEIRKSNAETDGLYIDKGVVSPEEVRERVSADPESGFNNLSGDAPPPPQQLDAEHGAQLDEGAAQAGHERELEKQKTAAKLKPAA